MATAGAYDEWEDVGMAFTEEDIASYDPQKWADQHALDLVQRIKVFLRHAELPKVEKPDWWSKAADRYIDVITWLCVATEIPGIDREAIRTLPDAKSAEGKVLTKEALDLVPEEWLGYCSEANEADLRYVVTIGRRCGKGWGKRNRSLNNKLANALVRERAALLKLEDLLNSRTA